MKRIVFWEYDAEDVEKIAAKMLKVQKEREAHPEKFPTTIFPPHRLMNNIPKMTKRVQSFSIVEGEDDQQTIDMIARWFPELHFKSIPIVETAKVREAVQKYNE